MPPDGSTDHERAIAENAPRLEEIKAASNPSVAQQIKAELAPGELEALRRLAPDDLTIEIVMYRTPHPELGGLSLYAALKSEDPEVRATARNKLNSLGA